MFIGLNPSKADSRNDDATIRRVKRFAHDWGYGGVYMLNCFSFVSTDPGRLKNDTDIDKNDEAIKRYSVFCDTVVFAWGSFPIVKKYGRDREMSRLFPDAMALMVNHDGSPRHPLFVPANTVLIPYCA